MSLYLCLVLRYQLRPLPDPQLQYGLYCLLYRFIFLKIPGELIDPNNDWFKAIVMEFVYESTASFSMTSKAAIFAFALSLIFTLAGIYTFKRRDL